MTLIEDSKWQFIFFFALFKKKNNKNSTLKTDFIDINKRKNIH